MKLESTPGNRFRGSEPTRHAAPSTEIQPSAAGDYMGPFHRLNTDFACGLAHKGLALGLEHPRKYSYRWLSQLADGKRAVSIDLTDVEKQPDHAQRCGREAAESLCAIDQTKKLHELAGRICPDAVLDSQESVRLARDVGLRLGT